ncbi:hypothetical protein, partial [Roseinatronobacter sp.]|uniref:hypothetical protein n=1 Tax=Roseinatronobacter sp. TaxID=1945755 RepID=UPI0025D83CAB
MKVQTAESPTRRSCLRDDPTCIGARIIAQVSADLSDAPTGAGGDVGAHLRVHLSAEVNTYFSVEPNIRSSTENWVNSLFAVFPCY